MSINWQRANIQAAAGVLRERISAGATDTRTKSAYEGLLDVLEPTRRMLRQQREMAAARAAVPVDVNRDRRARVERRASDRRVVNLGPPDGVERRKTDRRTGRDRRKLT